MLETFSGSIQEAQTAIETFVKSHPVVLFMKGNTQFPLCGFSGRAIALLKACGCAKPTTVDILKNPSIREAAKIYSEWPTYPQLYLQGQFIGGCDIMGDLFDKGDLAPLVQAALNPT